MEFLERPQHEIREAGLPPNGDLDVNGSSAVYFSSLEIENVRCFGGRQVLDLTDDDGRPAQWSLLIGENGTGKTTLLECLAWMCPVPDRDNPSPRGAAPEDIQPPTEGALTTTLPRADDKLLETLPRDTQAKVRLSARLTLGNVGFRPGTKPWVENDSISHISVEARLSFDERGELQDLTSLSSHQKEDLPEKFFYPLIVAYGANRYLGKQNSQEFDASDPSDHQRLSEDSELCDVEELLMALDYAAFANPSGPESRVLASLKGAISKILPEDPAVEIVIHPPDVLGTGRRSGVYAKTFTGPVRMSALSLGYRSTAGWVIDFAVRLSKRYSESADPLSEPAVVLIDEIDLHLHPLWQLQIIRDLSALFPSTQFVATSHSPLIVQVADNAKLTLLRKQGDKVNIEDQSDEPSKLRVDQILTSLLFRVPSSRSPSVQGLFDERVELLDKVDRTEEDENRLEEIGRLIDELPVAHDPEDRAAMELIRQFAASLEQAKEDGL